MIVCLTCDCDYVTSFFLHISIHTPQYSSIAGNNGKGQNKPRLRAFMICHTGNRKENERLLVVPLQNCVERSFTPYIYFILL